jgi:hypothetical protein
MGGKGGGVLNFGMAKPHSEIHGATGIKLSTALCTTQLITAPPPPSRREQIQYPTCCVLSEQVTLSAKMVPGIIP